MHYHDDVHADQSDVGQSLDPHAGNPQHDHARTTDAYTRRMVLKRAGLAVVGGSALATLGASSVSAAPQTSNEVWYNVNAYGAVGNGSTNDTAAIQSAINAAAADGGGTVFLPAGTYRITATHEPGVRFYGLKVPSKITLKGAGRDATVIKIAENQPDQCRIIANDNQVTGGDHHITFEDFTVDGNAANQSTAKSMVGIMCLRAHYVQHLRVRVIDVKGSPQTQPEDDPNDTCTNETLEQCSSNEGVFFDSHFCSFNSYTDCDATQIVAGTLITGSCFSATGSTSIEYTGCRASKSSTWQGFTTSYSRHVQYVNCHSFLNYQRGFNCEDSDDVHYVNCVAGGRSTSVDSAPYTANTSLGNTADGFYIYQSQRVQVSNCSSRQNQGGLVNHTSSDVRIIGGIFVGNRLAGLAFHSAADARSTRISGGPIVAENGTDTDKTFQLVIAGTKYATVLGSIAAPQLPDSGAGLYNPYPFDATVYIYGGAVQGISLAGQNIYGMVNGPVRVPAGTYIQVYYTSAPAWTWFID